MAESLLSLLRCSSQVLGVLCLFLSCDPLLPWYSRMSLGDTYLSRSCIQDSDWPSGDSQQPIHCSTLPSSCASWSHRLQLLPGPLSVPTQHTAWHIEQGILSGALVLKVEFILWHWNTAVHSLTTIFGQKRIKLTVVGPQFRMCAAPLTTALLAFFSLRECQASVRQG
jgi:hypothetical protein